MLLSPWIAFGSPLFLFPPVLFFGVINFVFIPCEEKMLGDSFREAFADYLCSVGRWLPRLGCTQPFRQPSAQLFSVAAPCVAAGAFAAGAGSSGKLETVQKRCSFSPMCLQPFGSSPVRWRRTCPDCSNRRARHRCRRTSSCASGIRALARSYGLVGNACLGRHLPVCTTGSALSARYARQRGQAARAKCCYLK